MSAKPASALRPVFWLLFYLGLLPWAGTRCLDWMSRPSDWLLGCGLLGLLLLAAGVVLSLCQAGRTLGRY
ncbi:MULTISPECIES: hypothetical protein [Hymenobacter]|uniref:Uncharacterized protein n=1 Tax=Hymenobacter armeniacus TaxID=2771358 RepID=A0ABR8JTV3_9BACT|nr:MULTISPECIES: hypothetical protein [Hymenobacter]MBD2723390.1 hypothetical protein [Hymenobacter armeniacus]MBJ6107404.1 hypothetical protein [Hymenobacter sp. BT523]